MDSERKFFATCPKGIESLLAFEQRVDRRGHGRPGFLEHGHERHHQAAEDAAPHVGRDRSSVVRGPKLVPGPPGADQHQRQQHGAAVHRSAEGHWLARAGQAAESVPCEYRIT
jgi:hypothetical protein